MYAYMKTPSFGPTGSFREQGWRIFPHAMSEVYTKKDLDDKFDTLEGALPFSLQQIAEDELGETARRRNDSLALLLRLLSGESCNSYRLKLVQNSDNIFSGLSKFSW